MKITKKDKVFALSAFLLLLSVGVIGWLLVGVAASIILSIISPILMLVVVLEVYRRLNEDYRDSQTRQEHKQIQDYRQIESLFSLFFTLKPSVPLPEMRGWACSPDVLKKIADVILMEKPGLVVEASSGVSTLVIAYCLKQLGRGKVVSLEHDAKFSAISQSIISSHGLEEIATIVHAPLKEIMIKDQKWYWYNTDYLMIDQPIDLLVVDGPPGSIQELSRYPAVPLLYKYLSKRSIIILDDGHRSDEKKIVSRWVTEFNDISSDFLDTETGAYILHRSGHMESA